MKLKITVSFPDATLKHTATPQTTYPKPYPRHKPSAKPQR
jgi:hypothetical protein